MNPDVGGHIIIALCSFMIYDDEWRDDGYVKSDGNTERGCVDGTEESSLLPLYFMK